MATLASIIPLFLLHKNQCRQPQQPVQTAWMKSITNLFYDALGAGEDPEVNIILQLDGEGPKMTIAQNLSNNLEGLFEFLGLETPKGPHLCNIFPLPHLILHNSTALFVHLARSMPFVNAKNHNVFMFLDPTSSGLMEICSWLIALIAGVTIIQIIHIQG